VKVNARPPLFAGFVQRLDRLRRRPYASLRFMRSCIAHLLIAGVVAIPAVAAAQSPEQKRLEVMVGEWRIDVDQKATPLSPATKASGTEACEWFANRHVVCRGEAKGPAGTYGQMRTLSYVPARKQYAAYTVDSLGIALWPTGRSAAIPGPSPRTSRRSTSG
jgi:hypothetical protein